MNKNIKKFIVGLPIVAALGVISFNYSPTPSVDEQQTQALAFGFIGGEKIQNAYEQWAQSHEARGGDANITMGLAYRKGLSIEKTKANGFANIDLHEGEIEVSVEGLDKNKSWSLWLVDQRGQANGSTEELTLNLGNLIHDDENIALNAEINPSTFDSFQIDLIVIAEAGESHSDGLLYGAPSVFQSLYTSMQSENLLALSEFQHIEGIDLRAEPNLEIGFNQAYAVRNTIFVDPDVLFENLVARGADLFLNETFNGNGRTCATCHAAADNFALNVTDVASLPDDDPLFAAEFMPALAFTPNGPKFEVPVLMRGNALILENQDGMDDLANNFNMRGVPHTLGLMTSIQSSQIPGMNFDTPGFAQATGWSGDGSPNNNGADGSLLFFATGAVIQHFPLTLNREPGVDFRLPTMFELQAMEAFQLTLGRTNDIVLPLNFNNPIVNRGQELFNTIGPGNPNCGVCHFNAGATINPNVVPEPGANFNFNTGVENQIDRPTDILLAAAGLDISPDFPGAFSKDGGFGGPDNPGNVVNDVANGFGNGAFNTASLIEAADTGGFFHDNSVSTIEAAVEFYNSDAFNNSPGGALAGGINMATTQVQAIASFLRVINALENLRSSTELELTIVEARLRNVAVGKDLLDQSFEELKDARLVLIAADLEPSAVAAIEEAINFNRQAAATSFLLRRDRLIRLSLRAQEQARRAMVSP